ncbi:bifunctional helix-turn-helix domain-containing protein/methylated-DNA--[protein]-cysteine S-methyltransferase [Desertivirga brevis]|uniref:bifunctional helix-turn-helix domain-containing protein/methylated-DNA--[protein]-cysteine S-methyltransferase n=1 Tax=Desertivirga brevis TaxID=2810310 RepID=UPI001A9756FB|nr:methylated-DNA--[protein]-cysteine S-methyltransferase [Pedobacter sp. SYSU D00873]
MKQEQLNYERIAKAIEYIRVNFKKQPSLEEIAEVVNLSPFHFQRLFTEWAGTSPKKFLQYISISYARKLLKETGASLFDVAYETGLSGNSRLHELFISIEGMTPAEYKNGGKDLNILFNCVSSPFGPLLLASTEKGICYMAFCDDEVEEIAKLRISFPQATYLKGFDKMQENALLIFQKDWSKLDQIKLHLKGTNFQLKVWESLLKIPMGKLSTYGAIAQSIKLPNASRAVGTAIGSNPVAFLIPCHRVIQSSGNLGGYMWGLNRKSSMIGWEASVIDPLNLSY